MNVASCVARLRVELGVGETSNDHNEAMMQNRYDNRYDRDHEAEDSFPGRREEREPRQYGGYNRDEEDSRYGERSERWRTNEHQPRQDFSRPSWSQQGRPTPNYGGRGQGFGNRFREDEYGERYPNRERQYGGQYGENRYGSREGEGYQQSGRRDRPDQMRGIYQEQVWTRDPSTGNAYGYEYSTRVEPRFGENANYDRQDRPRFGDWPRRDSDTWRRWNSPTSAEGYRKLASHYGKGPKGYVRSDERIREDVCDRLSDDDEVDASEITVMVKDGEVTLEGTVSDRHSKHRAEDIAESVSGVKDVTNKLRTRKSFMQELGDKITGEAEVEHRGHSGSGTRNSPMTPASKGAQSH